MALTRRAPRDRYVYDHARPIGEMVWGHATSVDKALALQQFGSIFAATANAAKRLQRLGVKPDRILVTGALQRGGMALPYVQSDREELATTLAGRPIWLAAQARLDEIETITAAHKISSRLAHRLLLIIAPDPTANSAAIHQKLLDDSWRVAQWSNGETPEENTQILLADTVGEMGLWYRLSPTSFIASSLSSDHHGQSPYDAAMTPPPLDRPSYTVPISTIICPPTPALPRLVRPLSRTIAPRLVPPFPA
jgi:3-deoxy-D-manno-octulosonic-acid transferase